MKAAAQSIQGNGASRRSNLIGRLLRHAETDSARDAIVSATTRLTYAEFAQRVIARAQRLAESGAAADSVVGIRCSNEIEHLLNCLALIRIGATSFAIPSHESQRFQDSLVDQCCATHVIDNEEFRPVATASISEAVQMDGACLLFSTSGTTGNPKLVVHHESDLVAQAHRHIDSKTERFACLASVDHNFVKRHRLYCIATGATNVFIEGRPASLVSQCQSLQINVLHVSAFQARELLALPDVGALSDVRLKLGGSHVPLKLRQQLKAQITRNLQAGYGTTETGAIAFTDPQDSDAGESVGRPLAGIEVRVVDADSRPVANGVRGELAIRCNGMFRAYLGNPELTAAKLIGGWFYTGDIGYLDDCDRIHMCGRSDDMFMFNSMNIYPQDIETRICRFPGVSEALVLPKQSEVHGSIPVAFVVFAGDEAPDLLALKAYVQKHVGVRCPRQFTSVERLPRNASGKLSRREATPLPERSDLIRSRMLDALNIDSTKRLKPAEIAAFKRGDIDIAIGGKGLDSFARMEMLVALELEFGVVITPEVFSQFMTFGDMSSYVLSPPPAKSLCPLRPSPAIGRSRLDDQQTRTLRFVQRVFHHCPTVAQLNKALGTLEHRLTPLEVLFLREQHCDAQLIAPDAAEKFQAAVTTWFRKMDHLLQGSEKLQPEPFVRQRVAPSAYHFVGPGSPSEKRLLICFAPKAGRQLTIPNAVLMQHTDASQYDLLVIADAARESYRTGIPLLGRNINEVIEWIANLELVNSYKAVRTIGCSAGAFLAVIAGYKLGAELALSVAGRFHAERYPHRILGRIIATWRTVRKSKCSRVLMSYPADKGKSRDRIYAQIIGKLTGGSLVGLEFTDGTGGHHFFQPLAERGELAAYLDHTIFAEHDDAIMSSERANVIFSLPAGTFRAYS